MNRVIVLLGPTGVGKTGVSLLLAKEFATEIISADSMQIYRHMDIGTAKPSVEEQRMVRHHMIDIVDPSDSFSVGKYLASVVPIIGRLHKENKIPIVVGGTGLYIKAMTRGLFSGPAADWTLREKLWSMEERSERSLYRYLKDCDPSAAEKITPNDTRRIIRALEVCLKSDASMSEMQKALTKPLPYEFVKIGLTRERKELYSLVDQRVDRMISAGLVKEVKNILAMGPDKTALQAIGYKEIMMYLEGKTTLANAVSLIKKGSRRYAKRQFTWFRKEEEVRWVDLTGVYESREGLGRVSEVLKTLL